MGESSLIELPSVSHELDEVSVVVDVGRNGRIVVVPLLPRDLSVTVLVAEAGQELHEDLLVGHLSRDHLWMVACVVDDAKVARVNHAVSVRVKLAVGLVDDLLAGLVGGATDSVKELVEADNAVLIRVQVAKKDGSLILRDSGTQVLQSPVELLHLDFAITVVVHDFEGAAHSTNGADATGVQASLNLLENCNRGRDVRDADWLVSYKKCSSSLQ